MLDIQHDKIEDFFYNYLKFFKMIKVSYVTNRYFRNVLKISPEILRSKKKPLEIIEAKKLLISEFKKLTQKARKEGIIEKVPYGYVLIE